MLVHYPYGGALLTNTVAARPLRVAAQSLAQQLIAIEGYKLPPENDRQNPAPAGSGVTFSPTSCSPLGATCFVLHLLSRF